MLQSLTIKETDKLLIIAPHPDDECIGAGGVLTLFPDICTVIVLTDGRLGQGDMAPEIGKQIRRAEFIKEMQTAGIQDYQLLDYADGMLMQHTDCLGEIALSVYTKIFVTGIHDDHPDHTAACLSVFKALQKQGLTQKEIYLYEVHSPLRQATHMLDITETIERKLGLIRLHQSQLGGLPYDRMMKCMAEYRALQNRLSGRYIEVYQFATPGNIPEDETVELEKRLQKSALFYWILTRWLEFKIKGRNTAELLERSGYHIIAVYGYAELGKLLCRELFNTQIQVAYILDRKVKKADIGNYPVYTPERGLPNVDSIIVTAVFDFEAIKRELSDMGFRNIISLKELLERKDY